jgi:hypothetical protein
MLRFSSWTIVLKKIIIIFFLFFASQAFAFHLTQGSAYAFADVLDWQIREGSDDDWAELISPTGTANPTVTLLQAPFRWNAGYRVGAGYKDNNQWDTVLYYTSYHTQASNQVSAPGQLYSPYIGNFFQNNTNGSANGPFYNAANVRWKINFNTLDWELGRTFYAGNIVNLRPFLGVKGAVINQNIYTNWTGPNTLILGFPVPITAFSSATENLTNYFTGVGPAFGLDTTWAVQRLARGSINLYGNFSAALLWGLWRYQDNYQTNGSGSVTVTGNNVNGAAPTVRGFVGIGWTGNFSKTELSVRLGYEGQVWFDQVQYNSLSSGRLSDIMSLQGGTLDIGVTF